jgi:hypothetical protein
MIADPLDLQAARERDGARHARTGAESKLPGEPT